MSIDSKVITSIIFKYTLKDQSTGFTYEGRLDVASINDRYSQDASVDILEKATNWVQKVELISTCSKKVMITWSIPPHQRDINTHFKSPITLIDISDNLGIPRYETNNSSFMIIGWSLETCQSPKNAEEIPLK